MFKRFVPRILCTAMLACAGGIAWVPAAAQSAQPEFILPNKNLTAEGIPPIPAELARRAGPYNDFRSRSLVEWHPLRREMLVATRTTGVGVQLHLLRTPLGELEQLTDTPDPVRAGTFEPKQGAYIVFARDEGGSEATQLYRLDLADRKVTLLTDPTEKHSLGKWNHAGTRLLFTSTQLDKTAAGGTRAQITTDVYSIDPLVPLAKRRIASLPGGGWGDFQWSPDDRQLAAMNYMSANESTVSLLGVADATLRQILPAPAMARATPASSGTPAPPAMPASSATSAMPAAAYQDLHYSPDGKALYVSTNAAGEFRELVRVDLATSAMTRISGHIAWDIEDLELPQANERIAAIVNNDGAAELHLFDGKTGVEAARPVLPEGAVTRLKWRTDSELGLGINSARSPGEIYALDLKTGKVEQWTTPQGSLDTSGFPGASIIRWKSFDGRTISGLLSKPSDRLAQFQGKRPVVILIHGGPEGQARVGFLQRYNYLINELGIALIQPNVRGSSGYGKTFLSLDDGYKREDSVKDIGALMDWIATQPDLDASRIVVMGGSYGGYMALAVSTNYPQRIRGAIDTVGISNFVSFLERTESYRRDLRRVEYGDERDPAMRAFLERIAPLNNAARIAKPLFVVQGKNDPRVPLFEAEQIVARVRKNNVPVWYLMADNEGHGFARKPNTDFNFFAMVRFLETYLLN